MGVETMSAKAVPTQPETEKVTTERANKPVALTELTAELDYASVLPQYTPLLVELDRLIAAEQKRFDMVPAQIAFERGCLALSFRMHLAISSRANSRRYRSQARWISSPPLRTRAHRGSPQSARLRTSRR